VCIYKYMYEFFRELMVKSSTISPRPEILTALSRPKLNEKDLEYLHTSYTAISAMLEKFLFVIKG
jgi:hypothetical protein